jgi:hypothetical protein
MDHVVPPGEDGHDDGSDAFGSAFFLAGSPEEAAHLAVLRERFGDEMVDRLQRSRELMRHPRPLADSERGVIREALAPVLRDLRATGAIVPEVREEARDDRAGEAVSAWVTSDDGGGMGVWVSLAGSPAERVAQLAEQVQEWEVEQLCWAGRSATWPECPEHPGSHPLEPAVIGGVAEWRCPRSQRAAGTIGGLELPAAWTYGAAPARRRAAVTS